VVYVLSPLVRLNLSWVPKWIFASALSMYAYSQSSPLLSFNNPILTPTQLSSWGTILVTGLWNFTLTLWNHRNTVVHKSTVEEQASIVMSTLKPWVTVFYHSFSQNPNFIFPWYHYLFTTHSLAIRLKHPYNHLQCWLHSVEEAIPKLLRQRY